MSDKFDPNSSTAMFATILEKLENIKQTAEETRAEVKKTNGRVTSLERWRDITKAQTGLIAVLVTTLTSTMVWLFKQFTG